jgi:hypothetical protein
LAREWTRKYAMWHMWHIPHLTIYRFDSIQYQYLYYYFTNTNTTNF